MLPFIGAVCNPSLGYSSVCEFAWKPWEWLKKSTYGRSFFFLLQFKWHREDMKVFMLSNPYSMCSHLSLCRFYCSISYQTMPFHCNGARNCKLESSHCKAIVWWRRRCPSSTPTKEHQCLQMKFAIRNLIHIMISPCRNPVICAMFHWLVSWLPKFKQDSALQAHKIKISDSQHPSIIFLINVFCCTPYSAVHVCNITTDSIWMYTGSQQVRCFSSWRSSLENCIIH